MVMHSIVGCLGHNLYVQPGGYSLALSGCCHHLYLLLSPNLLIPPNSHNLYLLPRVVSLSYHGHNLLSSLVSLNNNNQNLLVGLIPLTCKNLHLPNLYIFRIWWWWLCCLLFCLLLN